ncbi:MAG: S41 family peptidase, partial [Lachnospiraceae bacterium]|nr:S41 family peptidase [Lachnospiraceae bacterium]
YTSHTGEDKHFEPDSDPKSGRGTFITGLLLGIIGTLVIVPLIFTVAISRNKDMLGFVAGRLFAASGQYSETMDMGRLFRQMTQIDRLIDEEYVGEVDTEKVTDSILSGYVSGLDDPYTVYYSAKDMEMVASMNEGSYNGIGITITVRDDGRYDVVSVTEDSPADEAGFEVGDIIAEYDGTPVEDGEMDDLVEYIRNHNGEAISFKLIRGEGAEEIAATVTPSRVSYNSVKSEMKEDGIGYLKLLEFYDNSVEKMRTALEELKAAGMSCLVLDLRNNPGGTLESVRGIADFFLSDGLIFYVQDKNGVKTEFHTNPGALWDGPTVVLVNGNSASAAEVLTGMLKDHGLATIMGTQTFGKGIMQSVYRLSDRAGLKMTMAHYYTPAGNDIHKIGIEPDIVVEPGDDADKDAQLDAALEEAEKLLGGNEDTTQAAA